MSEPLCRKHAKAEGARSRGSSVTASPAPILYVESDAARFATRTTISVDLGLRAK
jgi:hypothetical protein